LVAREIRSKTAGHSLFRRNPQATKSGPERRRLHPEQGRRAIVVGERSLVALPVAQTSDKRRQTGSIADHEMIGLNGKDEREGLTGRTNGKEREGQAPRGTGRTGATRNEREREGQAPRETNGNGKDRRHARTGRTGATRNGKEREGQAPRGLIAVSSAQRTKRNHKIRRENAQGRTSP
jgi:hypothetical protein